MISAPSAADSGLKANGGGRSSASARARSIPIAPSMPWAPARRGSSDYGPQGSRCSRLLRIDQDEGDAAGLGAAIDPGVIGALLHQYVARLEMNFRIVEQHVDLAGHDDGVIHRARAVHGWMARRQSALGRAVAKALVHAVGIELARFGRFRRKIDDAKDRAAARRHDTDIDRSPVGA